MPPSLLIVHPDGDRRESWFRELEAHGHLVQAAASAEQGFRYLERQVPRLMLAPEGISGISDAAALSRRAALDARAPVPLLITGPTATTLDELPFGTWWLALPERSDNALAAAVDVLLLSLSTDLPAADDLSALVTDLALLPLLQLVRTLSRVRFSGTVEIAAGSLALEHGDVTAVTAGQIHGIKAFCRLSRISEGAVRVSPGRQLPEREIGMDTTALVLKAVEERQQALPHRRSRLIPTDHSVGELPQHLRRLLSASRHCATFGELLDHQEAPDGVVAERLAQLVDRDLLHLEAPRSPVAVLTDSTADLPTALAVEHSLTVVPLTILFGDEHFRDGVDIQARDFYRLLGSSDVHPATAPPSQAVFEAQLAELADEQDVLAIHLSGLLSETARNCAAATRRHLADRPPGNAHQIRVVDSRNVSLGVGLLALFAARLAERGESLSAIADRIQSMIPRVHTLFVVDTLDFLARGGRIGSARALLGRLLGIKPILGVVDGEVASIDRARGGRTAQERLLALIDQRVDARHPIVAAVAHASAPVWGDRLRQLIEARFALHELLLGDIGPVVGTHAGPGCVGAVVFQPSEEEWPLIAPLGEPQPSAAG